MKISALTMALSAGLCLSAVAADFTWLGKTANWKDALGWKNGSTSAESDWVDGQNTIFPDSAPIKAVVVDGDVTPGALHIQSSYSFSGSGLLTLKGTFDVAAGAKATFNKVPIAASTDPLHGGAGALVFQDNSTTMKRLVSSGTGMGTITFNGGEHRITSKKTSSTGDMGVHLNGGRVVVKGGAYVTVTNTHSFSANSGAVLEVEDGVFDLYKVGEYLHGFADTHGDSKSTNSIMTVRNKGTVIFKACRLGKVQRATFEEYGQTYGRTTLETGGVFVVHNFTMDSTAKRDDYCARVDFDGGTLVVTNENSTRFDISAAGGNWSNVVMNVKEGGMRLRIDRSDCYANFNHPLASAAEKDGGLSFFGKGYLYLGLTNWPSSYNGGVHLKSTTTCYLIPTGFDRAFGAVPPEPTPNVFFESTGPILQFGETWATHPNRTFQIGAKATANIGAAASKVGRIGGVITGSGTDGAFGKLRVVNNWTGCVEIGPEDGRTNTIGMVQVDGWLRHVAGTTLVTSNNSSKTTTGAPLYVKGNGASFNASKGVLEIAGGTFRVTRSVWCDISSYGQVIVTNGHLDVSATAEFLNGLTSPGRTIIGGNGLMTCNQLRITQTTIREANEPAAQVHVLKGGTLKLNNFWLDVGNDNKSQYQGVVLLDGGTVVARKDVVNFLGGDDQYGKWHRNIFVRAGANGAIVDTDGHTVTIKNPILSGAANDGGFTKRGVGTLTLNSTNSYNGVTRVDAGLLKFAHADGFPGGDLEVSAKALKDNARTAELINAVNLTFKDGAKVRVVDADEVGPEAFGKRVILAKAANPIASLPEVLIVDKDGTERPGGADWNVSLASDGKTLTFGAARGSVLLIR